MLLKRFERTVAVLLVAHLLAILAMAASSQLHGFFHHGANHDDHRCAVTDMLSGAGGDGSFSQPITVAAILPHQFHSVAEFDPVWIASLFLTNCVLEHAPPALS